MATHSSVLAWRIPGTGEPVGCRLWGCTELDTTEATQRQQQQSHTWASQVVIVVKNPPVHQCRGHKRHEFDPWVGKIPQKRVWQLTPVFLPEEFPGQRSLAVYSPQGRKESDMTEGTQLTRTKVFRKIILEENEERIRIKLEGRGNHFDST